MVHADGTAGAASDDSEFGRFKKRATVVPLPPGTLCLGSSAYRRLKKENPEWPGSATILTRFGSWNAACKAAGIQPAGARRPKVGLGSGFGAKRYTDDQVVATLAQFVKHADASGIKVTVKAYQEWAVLEDGRVKEGALRRRLLAPKGRWGSWGEMISDVRGGEGVSVRAPEEALI